MGKFSSLEWSAGVVRMLDQRRLPQEVVYLEYRDYVGVAQAITDMVIRGAPAIGAAAAYGLALVPYHLKNASPVLIREELMRAAQVLRNARPTAVNLAWAVDRMMRLLNDSTLDTAGKLSQAFLREAQAIVEENVQMNKQIGLNALPLVADQATFIHHCNTGALATVDYGTALGVIRTAHEHGKRVFVLVDETRPRLQGARLTAWELQQYGIPFKVIVDGASGHYLRRGEVDLCVVGADRIAANGDTANKIGTYNLSVVAHENGVPFYVVAPTTTVDLATANGDDIPIEERSPNEVTHVGDCQITPDGVEVGNPAFDVTPAKYITAIITEKGVAYPPYMESLAKQISG